MENDRVYKQCRLKVSDNMKNKTDKLLIGAIHRPSEYIKSFRRPVYSSDKEKHHEIIRYFTNCCSFVANQPDSLRTVS